MIKPKAGTVTLDGEVISGKKSNELVPKGMAHAPEGRGIFLNLTVDENLTLGAYLKSNKAEIEADRHQAFTLFPRLLERRSQRAAARSSTGARAGRRDRRSMRTSLELSSRTIRRPMARRARGSAA
jgi:ABC-type branched-subunit amino acid transport system ATPase component